MPRSSPPASSGPIDQVVPGLTRLADTLGSPVLTSLPKDLGSFVEALNDLVRRLAPLAQMADSASGLFGLRIPGMSRAASPPALTVAMEPPAPAAQHPPATKRKAPAKRKANPKKKKKAAPEEGAGQQVVAIGTSASMITSTRRSAAISESDGAP